MALAICQIYALNQGIAIPFCLFSSWYIVMVCVCVCVCVWCRLAHFALWTVLPGIKTLHFLNMYHS